MLADLPNARELYKDHVWPDEAEEQAACWEAEEEGVFVQYAAGLDDNPEAYKQQGLFDKADNMPGKLEEQAGQSVEGKQHDWVWTGQTWQCYQCLRQCRNRKQSKNECGGVSPSLKEAFTIGKRHAHKLTAAIDSRHMWVCWCAACGSWASHKAIKLKKDCKQATKQGKIVLSRVRRQEHPDGTKASLGRPVPLHQMATGHEE